jgi:hypothetical protein
MPAPTGIKIVGLNKTIRELRSLEGIDPELKKIGLESAQIVVNRARPLTPVRTGRLQGSIKASPVLRGAVVKAGNKGKLAYAAPIHWGWPARNITGMPFITAALRYTKAQVLDTYEKGLQKLINHRGLGR